MFAKKRKFVGVLKGVSKETNGEWIKYQKITASNGKNFDQFGWSVDMRENIIVVGTPYHEDESINNGDTGAAYWFEQTGENWVE